MTLDDIETDETPSPLTDPRFWKRVLFLARDFSALEISRMRGMLDARTLYSAIATDPALQEQFLKANNQYRRSRRAAVADLLHRSRQTDLSCIFVELRKLKTKPMQCPEKNSSEFDLTLLSDDELAALEHILRKATPSKAALELSNEQIESEGPVYG